MTHEELLAKIKDTWADDEFGCSMALHALRAVVEMHYPHEITWAVKEPFIACYSCAEEYPCPTIEVIQENIYENRY